MHVLASPAFENRRANPYNAALYTALQRRGVVVGEFAAKRRVWLESWDVVHLHWPDAALNSRNVFVAALRAAHLLARVLYTKLRGAKIVWTVHNLRAHHSAHARLEAWLWRAFVPLVDGAISLSHSGRELARQKFPGLARKADFVIPHGHYRDCYENDYSQSAARLQLGLPPERPVIAFVGQIKTYKNIPALLHAFLEKKEADSAASLLIAGQPGSAGLAAELIAIANGRDDVHFRFGHIAETEMQLPLNACNLAVFPYRDILNSGSAILALSFDRPVLVPAKGAMAELRDMVGAEWVMTYEGKLTDEVLREALRWALEAPRPVRCDLGALAWDTLAAQTLAAYETLVGLAPSCAKAAAIDCAR